MRHPIGECLKTGYPFLVFQSQQEQGLPNTKEELRNCYQYFRTLQSSWTPCFSDLLYSLNRVRVLRCDNSSGKVIFLRRVCKFKTKISSEKKQKTKKLIFII